MEGIGFYQYMSDENYSGQILQDPYPTEHPGSFGDSFHGAGRGKYTWECILERQVQIKKWTAALCVFPERSRSWLTGSCQQSL